ncbi:hypothetical protein EV182_008639, partial [Spiromyces aspiralis]
MQANLKRKWEERGRGVALEHQMPSMLGPAAPGGLPVLGLHETPHMPVAGEGAERARLLDRPFEEPGPAVSQLPSGEAAKPGWLRDQGKRNTCCASIAKALASETANKCARDAVQIFGG